MNDRESTRSKTSNIIIPNFQENITTVEKDRPKQNSSDLKEPYPRHPFYNRTPIAASTAHRILGLLTTLHSFPPATKPNLYLCNILPMHLPLMLIKIVLPRCFKPLSSNTVTARVRTLQQRFIQMHSLIMAVKSTNLFESRCTGVAARAGDY